MAEEKERNEEMIANWDCSCCYYIGVSRPDTHQKSSVAFSEPVAHRGYETWPSSALEDSVERHEHTKNVQVDFA